MKGLVINTKNKIATYKHRHAKQLEDLLLLMYEQNPQHSMSAIEVANRLAPIKLIESILHKLYQDGKLSTTVEPMKRSYRLAPAVMNQDDLKESLLSYLGERSQHVILTTLHNFLKVKGDENKDLLEIILSELVSSGVVTTKQKKKGRAYILTSKIETS